MNDFVREICRMGEGSRCCRYLSADGAGFHCLKLEADLALVIDAKVARGAAHACGDNCAGKPMEKSL